MEQVLFIVGEIWQFSPRRKSREVARFCYLKNAVFRKHQLRAIGSWPHTSKSDCLADIQFLFREKVYSYCRKTFAFFVK